MGTIFKGYQKTLEREVAIKKLFTSAILILRIIIPYSMKFSLIVGLTSASVAVATLLLARYFLGLPQLPELLFISYVGEHFMMVIIGAILAKMLN